MTGLRGFHMLHFGILLSITIGISLFLAFQFTFSDSLTARERIFYQQDFDQTTNKIILLGSSHVGQINATLVNSVISSKIPNSIVYNLASSSNTPSERLPTIDQVMKLKPGIVVYGVGYRDFSEKFEFNKKDALLPDPEKIVHDSLRSALIDNNIGFLDNPKLVTLNTIRDFLKTDLSTDSSKYYKEMTPFYPYEPANISIEDIIELERNYDENSDRIEINLKDNYEIDSMKEIITRLQENNITVILFSTPHQKFYTDLIPFSEKTAFNSILNDISQEYGVDIHFLENRYSTLNIWASVNHVSTNPDSIVYSEDIAKMILKEFE